MVQKKYQLPELGYRYDDLEPAYSADLLEVHYSKHHQGYVDGANQTMHDLADARSKSDLGKLKQLQKDLAFNLSGHVMHSLFWRNMAPSDGNGPDANLSKSIDQGFGSFKAFQDQFQSAGGSIQGSGWAALSWDPLSQSLLVEQLYDHQNNSSCGAQPILVMDMWEHAFYLQYRNEKKRWIDAFWGLINWQDVGNRLKKAQQGQSLV